ncbi:hypothetical protein A0257_16880 [Hymenobacter psoromatis]|nr:hypothetical protein A0257_16880 [Hymenobacter psoromatis]
MAGSWRGLVTCPVAGLPAGLGSAMTALAYAPGSGLWVGTAAEGIYLLPAKIPAWPCGSPPPAAFATKS